MTRVVKLLFWAAWTAASLAQTAPPTIESVNPRGLRPGNTAKVTIEGRNLDGATGIAFEHPGFRASIESVEVLSRGGRSGSAGGTIVEDQSTSTRVVATITAPGRFPAEQQSFRLNTALGSTNLAMIDIRDLPLTDDARVQLPATVEGALKKPGDARSVSFEASPGETLVFELVARRIGSRLDGVLSVVDAAGREVGARTVSRDGDPAIYHRFDSAGAYTLRLGDRLLQGSDKHFYRLHMGKLPLVTGAFPRGLQRGRAAAVALEGVNLPRATLSITPASRENPGGRFTEEGVTFLAADYPAVTIPSPAADPAGATRVTLPVAINARAESPKPAWFRFSAKAGERIYFEVFAQRFGSPVDSLIEVRDARGNPIRTAYLRATMKTALTRLARVTAPILDVEAVGTFRAGDYAWMNGELLRVSSVDTTTSPMIVFDGETRRRAHMFTTALHHPIGETIYRVEVLPPDRAPQGRGLPVFEVFAKNDDGGAGYGRDSHLEFTAPADGDYFATVRDARGLHGRDYAYILTIAARDPDFAVSISPGNPNVPAGGRIPVTLSAARSGGFTAAIDVRLEGLPAGVRCVPCRIPADRSTVTVALEADAQAQGGTFPLRAVGTGEIGGRRVERAAPAQPLDYLTVVRAPADVILSLEPGELVLVPGQFTKAKVKVRRAAGFQDRVPIRVVGLPLGVFVRGTNDGPGVIVHEKTVEAEIEIEADPAAPAVETELFATGTVETSSPIPSRHVSLPVKLRVAR